MGRPRYELMRFTITPYTYCETALATRAAPKNHSGVLSLVHSDKNSLEPLRAVANSAPAGDMLLAMQPNVLRFLIPATAGAATALDAGSGGRVWKQVRWATLRVLFAAGVLQLTLAATQARAQDSGVAPQDSAPIQITPAPSNPSSNSAPLEPIFPQSSLPPSAPAARSSRGATPMGPASEAGLGFGPIRPGDIVEVAGIRFPGIFSENASLTCRGNRDPVRRPVSH